MCIPWERVCRGLLPKLLMPGQGSRVLTYRGSDVPPNIITSNFLSYTCNRGRELDSQRWCNFNSYLKFCFFQKFNLSFAVLYHNLFSITMFSLSQFVLYQNHNLTLLFWLPNCKPNNSDYPTKRQPRNIGSKNVCMMMVTFCLLKPGRQMVTPTQDSLSS